MASPYTVSSENRAYIEEFLKTPVGHHDLGLQCILTVFRGEPLARIVHEKYTACSHYCVMIQLVTQEKGGDTLFL